MYLFKKSEVIASVSAGCLLTEESSFMKYAQRVQREGNAQRMIQTGGGVAFYQSFFYDKSELDTRFGASIYIYIYIYVYLCT